MFGIKSLTLTDVRNAVGDICVDFGLDVEIKTKTRRKKCGLELYGMETFELTNDKLINPIVITYHYVNFLSFEGGGIILYNNEHTFDSKLFTRKLLYQWLHSEISLTCLKQEMDFKHNNLDSLLSD